MSVQLYAKTINKAQYQLLDLFTDEPIKLTLSVANIVDPLAANSVFSRTFRVPHTSVNGPFFQAVFNVNSTNFDASKKAEAYLNDNGSFFASGNIRLTNIFVNEEANNIEYEINFYGETSDFGSKIGGGFLSEVDLTQYDHAQSYLNVTNSWNYNLFGGDIVYPLAEWGYTYANGLPQLSTLAYGGTNGFTSPSHPLQVKQFKPAIRAKALWDAIFEETGYTYTSSFLDSSLFRNLYVISENEARAEITADLKFQAEATSAVTYQCGTVSQVLAQQEIIDVSNSYNAPTSRYTAKANGVYDFNIECVVHGSFATASATAAIWSIRDTVTGTILGTSGSPTTILGGTNFSFVTESIPCALTVGQTVELIIDVFGTGNPTDSVDVFGNAFYLSIAPTLITMTSFMPNNIRKIDFMRSIINRFRLVFVPSKDNQKEFEIVPWKDWILSGTEKDWTLKLDGSKDMKITPLFYGQDRLQVFKDQEDADFINYNYQLDYKQTYGQRNLDSNNELIKGTKVYQDQFAPLPLWPIGNADYDGSNAEKAAYKFLIPHLAKDTDKERQPIQPKLRLAFYNTNQPVPEITPGNPLYWYFYNGAAPIQQGSYPLMSQYSTWPVTNTTYDLSWENEPPLYNTENSGLAPNRTPFDTFSTYWKTWYDTNFDPYSRIVEANFVLDYEDIYDLKFNDYIFVKDSWYFVNKVTDYIAGEDTNCRVELIKLGNSIGLTLPLSSPFLTAIPLCKGKTICDAYCCNTTNATPITAYSYANDLTSSVTLYSDIYGTIPLANGYYSDGTYVAIVSNGAVVSYGATSDCDCTPPTLYEHIVCYGATNCDAFCCANGTRSVWTDSPIFDTSAQVYLDAFGTMPANGWFNKDASTTSIFVENGVVWAVNLTNNCDCDPTIVYPHDVYYLGVLESGICDICCGGNLVTVYTEGTVFATADHLWINNIPLTDAPAGYYRDPITGDVLIVDANGDVTAINNCVSCTCLYYYIGENCNEQILQNFSYPTPLALGTVVKSSFFDDQCWTLIDYTDNGYPIDEIFYTCDACAGDTCVCKEFGVSMASGGTIQYLNCNSQVQYMDLAPETSYVICACEGSIIALTDGKLTIQELGPCQPPLDLNQFEAYYIGTTETLCQACCADGTIGTYYGAGTSFETSLNIYLNATGTLQAPNGYYKDLNGYTYFVSGGQIQYALDCNDCVCEYHYIVTDCDGMIGNILNYPTALAIGTVVSSNAIDGVCWVIDSITTTPGTYDIDVIYGTCNECKGLPCDCLQYDVSADAEGGSISYINCETSEVNYMDISGFVAYRICACAGSIIPLSGNIVLNLQGPCPTETYNPINTLFIANTEVSGCTACCDTDGTTVTVYGNGTTLANSTLLYGDINGETLAPKGYYRDLEGITYFVDELGYVFVYNCADCPPCPIPIPTDALYVPGSFATYGGVSSPAFAAVSRLTNEATVGFNIGAGFTHSTVGIIPTTTDILIHAGAIYVVGNFTHYKGTPVTPGIVKLTPAGDLDPSFVIGTGFVSTTANQTRALQVKSFGTDKILVSGFFCSYNGTNSSGLVCLNNDGTINSGFVVGTGSKTGNICGLVSIITVSDTQVWVKTDTWKGVSYSQQIAIRLNSIGNVELTYAIATPASNMVVDSIGRIYALVLEGSIYRIRRFLTTGILDNTYGLVFSGQNPATSPVVTLAIDSSDNLFIQTTNTALLNGVSFKNIAKYDATGTKVTAFNITPGFSPNALYSNTNPRYLNVSLKVIGDSLYYFGTGQTSATYNSVPIGNIVKISAITGAIDTSFVKKDALLSGGGNTNISNITLT